MRALCFALISGFFLQKLVTFSAVLSTDWKVGISFVDVLVLRLHFFFCHPIVKHDVSINLIALAINET